MERDTVFISKATSGDDNFALWLAPKLEAASYCVFASLRLCGRDESASRSELAEEPSDTLRDRAIKMLLCCRNSTLSREGSVAVSL